MKRPILLGNHAGGGRVFRVYGEPIAASVTGSAEAAMESMNATPHTTAPIINGILSMDSSFNHSPDGALRPRFPETELTYTRPPATAVISGEDSGHFFSSPKLTSNP